MPETPTGSPHGIPKFQLTKIESLAQSLVGKSIAELTSDIDKHVSLATAAKAEYQMLNLSLATLIGERLKSALGYWDTFNESQQFWILGAIAYFVDSDDEEDDFRSPIGFEDDAEVFNACIRFAGHDDLVIDKEDF